MFQIIVMLWSFVIMLIIMVKTFVELFMMEIAVVSILMVEIALKGILMMDFFVMRSIVLTDSTEAVMSIGREHHCILVVGKWMMTHNSCMVRRSETVYRVISEVSTTVWIEALSMLVMWIEAISMLVMPLGFTHNWSPHWWMVVCGCNVVVSVRFHL